MRALVSYQCQIVEEMPLELLNWEKSASLFPTWYKKGRDG